ncbi:MAG: DMT family transporter [Candidatus Binatia bacterium]
MSPVPFATLGRTLQHLPANLRGALWVILAATLLTIMGVMVKQLGRDLHTFEIVFFRCVIGAVLMAPFILRAGLNSLRTQRPGLHALRVSMGITAMACVFYAYAHMPFAEAVAIIYSRPLFAVALAILLLGETVGWRRISAAVMGFLGVLIMVRPGTAAFDPASLVAVAAAVMAGCLAVIIKRLSRTETTTTIVMWFTVGGAAISFVPTLIIWSTPTIEQWALLFLIGALGVAGQLALTRGFSTGETSFVTPFDYMRLVFATFFGFLLFGEVPDIWAIVGALVIVGSGYYIARRELVLARRGGSRERATS